MPTVDFHVAAPRIVSAPASAAPQVCLRHDAPDARATRSDPPLAPGLTAGGKSLSKRHFDSVGIDPDTMRLGIVGMEEYDEFRKVILEESKVECDVDLMRSEVVDAAKKLLRLYPDTEAFVFECSDMPPFSAAVQTAVGLPVFDFITMIRYAHSAVAQRSYNGFI